MDIWNELTDAFNKEMAIDEMRKKYEHTYLVLCQPNGRETVVHYQGYADNYHHFKDENNVPLKLRHETDYKIVCKFPERCLFNTTNQALEFIRKPHRQYKRGICKENIQIYSPVRYMWSKDVHPWTHATIVQALYPTYPESCEVAINQLDSREVLSVALNPKFMITLPITINKEMYHLFYCNVLIGEFLNGVFKIHHPLFKQEVLDNMHLFKPYRIEL